MKGKMPINVTLVGKTAIGKIQTQKKALPPPTTIMKTIRPLIK